MRFYLSDKLLKTSKRRRSYVEFTLLQLLQHNVQLGAAAKFSLLSSHWFIYGVRQRFTIINLSQTIVNFRYFLEIVRAIARSRRHALLVNERHFATTITRDVAQSVGEAYIIGRWVGGSLTNFKRIWRMYRRVLRGKELSQLPRARLILQKSLVGLSVLKSLPAVVFFNSARASFWGSGETYALHIPAAALADTDSYPHSLLYPVPGNDDSFGSVLFANQLIAKTLLVAKMVNMVKNYHSFCEKLRLQTLRSGRKKSSRVSTASFGIIKAHRRSRRR